MAEAKWLADNAVIVTAMANVVMALIWGSYATLFYRDFTRHRSPRLVLTLSRDSSEGCALLLANMGRESVLLETIMVAILDDRGNERAAASIVEQVDRPSGETIQARETSTAQGPVASGEMIALHDQREIIAAALWGQSHSTMEVAREVRASGLDTLEVRVIFYHGPERRPAAATRRFRLQLAEGHMQLMPIGYETAMLTPRRAHRRIRGWLDYLWQPSIVGELPDDVQRARQD